MRILITGASGQLGRSLQHALVAHEAVALTHADLDVTDALAVDAAFNTHKPVVVIHTAALTDTARCEREPAVADAVNALGSEHVARASARLDVRCVLVSTNEVFDGANHSAYAEDDEPHPVNVYGTSKLRGERLGLEGCPEAVIVRTSWVYGEGATNFVEKVRAAGRTGRELRFVTDEIAAATSAADLASAIRALIEKHPPAGIYHLVNEGECSRYEWAREILRLAGMPDVPVEAVTTAQLRAGGYTGPTKPRYSVLANTRARSLGSTLRPWQEALAAYFEDARVAADG
ncbi:MAG: dTDP-4-dehydrorhamnose reductase [Chloroflexota bacterium]|nr:dTDP-4-dehydrorhamnose reductase [Chloroflexota bacterium]